MALPLPQQQQIRMMMRMIHRQEQLLFPLLKHICVTSLCDSLCGASPEQGLAR